MNEQVESYRDDLSPDRTLYFLRPLLQALPLLVLGAAGAALFYVLGVVLPPALDTALYNQPDLPPVARLLPLAAKRPVEVSLLWVFGGGVAFILNPRRDPLQLAAWYLASALLLVLWGSVLFYMPRTCLPEVTF